MSTSWKDHSRIEASRLYIGAARLRQRCQQAPFYAYVLGAVAVCTAIVLLCWTSSWMLSSGGAGSWDGIAEEGPDANPSAWRASQPPVLILAFREWAGVFSAASAQGPVLGTLKDFSPAAAQRLVNLIDGTPSLRVVVIHGVPPGSIVFARALRSAVPRVRILLVYHGTASAPFHEEYDSPALATVVAAARDGVIDAVGTVKVGFAPTFLALGVPAVFTVPNFPNVAAVLPTGKYSGEDGRVHVGLLTSSGAAHKNVATQVLAACAIPGVVVHVTFRPKLAYLNSSSCDIVETGFLSHGRFLVEVARMDVLMYVSLTECYPMLVLEAITLGIPVVVSRTHHMFDVDALLNAALVVDEADNPDNVRRVLEGAIARIDELRPRLLALALCLQHAAELAWGDVLRLSSAESRRLHLNAYAELLEARERAAVVEELPLGGDDGGATRAEAARHRPPRRHAMARLAAPRPVGAAPMPHAMPLRSPLPLPLPPACAADAFVAASAAAVAPPVFPPLAIDSVVPAARHVAFITYELSPGSAGGAGVLISALAEELLVRGHRVSILAYAPAALLKSWSAHMRGRGWRVGAGEQLVVRSVQALAGEAALAAAPCNPRNIFLQRSGVFAVAAAAAYAADPFDVLEVFDYAGAGFELLRRRHEWLYAAARGAVAEAAEPPYLPLHVPIVVRLHGSMQLILQAEGAVEPDRARAQPCLPDGAGEAGERAAWPLMFLMERYALMTATATLPQSLAMRDVYAQAYGLALERSLLAPPPTAAILEGLRGVSRRADAGAESRPAKRAPRAAAPLRRAPGAPSQLRLLVYGRIAHMKGSETVAAAAGAVQAALPAGMTLHLAFVGLDWECPLHRRRTSACVRAILPHAVSVSFAPPVERAELPQLAASMDGAIVASEFETYGLAAHELAAVGLPLVISDIPAFSEFFSDRNAYVYRAGDAGALARAILVLAADVERGAPRVARIAYADAIEPYERLFAAPPLSPPLPDMRLVEAAIDALEGPCWPSAACRAAGQRDQKDASEKRDDRRGGAA